MTREELQTLLDIHGGDPARWPPEKRAAMAELCARDAVAGRMLAEARALHALLAEATAAAAAEDDASAEAFVDRILAAAGNAPEPRANVRVATGGGDVIPLRQACRKRPAGGAHAMPASADDEGPAPWRWVAAGMLAASLMIGMWLGGVVSSSPVGESLLGPTRLAAAGDPTLETIDEILEVASAADDGGELP